MPLFGPRPFQHGCAGPRLRENTRTRAHACVLTHTHTHVRAHTHTHTRTHACIHACTHQVRAKRHGGQGVSRLSWLGCLLSQTRLQKWTHLQPSLSEHHINSQNFISSNGIEGSYQRATFQLSWQGSRSRRPAVEEMPLVL